MKQSFSDINDDKNGKEMPEEDKALRPKMLVDFTGQIPIKEKLAVSLKAALFRGEALDHVLFSGPPGLGKTTLASIITSEMNSRFHSTAAPAISKPRDLARLLTLLEERDILFIDEIHRLSHPCEEILYPAMEDGYIDFIIGEGITAQSIKVNLKPFTLIGATTRTGMLSSPLKDRFGLEFKLEYYEIDEISSIILRTANLLQLKFTPEAAQITASRSRMTPRVANRLVRRIRDYATVNNAAEISAEFAENCLGKLGMDNRGLNEMDRKLLRLMIERYDGGPVGIKTLSALVDEEERTLEEDHEPYLLRTGFWEKTPQGRMVTEKGYDHLDYDIPRIGRGKARGTVKERELF